MLNFGTTGGVSMPQKNRAAKKSGKKIEIYLSGGAARAFCAFRWITGRRTVEVASDVFRVYLLVLLGQTLGYKIRWTRDLSVKGVPRFDFQGDDRSFHRIIRALRNGDGGYLARCIKSRQKGKDYFVQFRA